MKIADMQLGEVYAYDRGHAGKARAVLMLDLDYYLVVRTDTDVVVRKSVGRHSRPLRGARGLLAIPAPADVWALVREGKEPDPLSFNDLYSRYLIITDNLPAHENDDVHFSFAEFGEVVVLTPAQVRGRLVDQFASVEELQRQRDEKYAKQAAEEQRLKDAVETARQKADRHGATTVQYVVGKNNRARVQMSPEDFALLMSLVPARKKR